MYQISQNNSILSIYSRLHVSALSAIKGYNRPDNGSQLELEHVAVNKMKLVLCICAYVCICICVCVCSGVWVRFNAYICDL